MPRFYHVALAYVAGNVILVFISFQDRFHAWSPIDALYFFTLYGPPLLFLVMAIAAIISKERPYVYAIIFALTGLLAWINYSALYEAAAAV
ncbi:MAG: hypothetical protein SGJ19_04140 [Planctomycetia bacterium]|nr:hypothetical protein [Planctomycetia bacterium]